MEKKRVSIGDVARAARVAPSTVSKTLNRTSQRRKPTEIQNRIRRIALEMGYRPSHSARSLSTGRTNIIGMYWGYDFDVLDPTFAQILNGVRAGCRLHRKNLLIHGTFHKHKVLEDLTNGKTDGLVVYPMTGDHTVSESLADSNLPVVSVAFPLPGIPLVRADWAAGMQTAVDRLGELGHTFILYRNVMLGEIIDNRFDAFRAAVERRGLRYVETHAADWNGRLSAPEAALLSGTDSSRPTAAVCFNDTFAYALLAHCTRVGIKAPDDLAIVGYDGAYTWSAQRQVLTTLDASWDTVARTAVDLLIDRIENRPVPLETILPVTWRQGETT
ncbi:MAG: LacI family DNA-binding transcriptional regulator [Capsulimonadaceae bacterium]